MRIEPAGLAGAFIIDPEPFEDERGLFARTFCEEEFGRYGLATMFVQSSTSFSVHRGTVRGLHYQLPPAAEIKLVRCTAGSIWDVIVDLRTDSETYLRHVAVELTATNRRALYIPEAFAHGFQTMAPNSEVFYQMTVAYAPDLARGIRYDEPMLDISWPLAVSAISSRDQQWPSLTR